jgi:hypothetical protein
MQMTLTMRARLKGGRDKAGFPESGCPTKPLWESSFRYNKGELPVAFLFSAPGATEELCDMPIAGITGENLDAALTHLAAARPDIFTSQNRYSYRIVNAFERVLARSRGDNQSEAKNTAIRLPSNVKRVLKDLEGCGLVVLCGRKAQLLQHDIQVAGHLIVAVSHTSNQALAASHNAAATTGYGTPAERRSFRVSDWASDLLCKLCKVVPPEPSQTPY